MHRRHDGFDTSNYEPPPRATRQERTGGASKPFLSNKPPQGILQYAASQSQSRQQIRLGYLVRHPHFHERIWSVKEELDKAVESRDEIPSQQSSMSWKLAATPENQHVEFLNPILPPPRIQNETDSQIAILVLSDQANFQRRQAIRATWANNSNHLVYFVIGHSNCNISEQYGTEMNERIRNVFKQITPPENGNLSTPANASSHGNATKGNTIQVKPCVQREHEFLWQEQNKFHDLLEIPMIESYRQLPEKVIQAYNWALQQLPNSVQWLVKADDDTYVRIDSLQQYIRKYNPSIPMWIGKIVPHSKVSRQGKWAETDHYAADYYPYWAQGSAGHVLSRVAAVYIVDNSPSLHRYQGEDVSLGIWLDEGHQSGQLAGGMTYIHAKQMITNDGIDSCGKSNVIMVGHDLSVDDMYDCFLKFGNQTLQENAWLDDPSEFREQIAMEADLWETLDLLSEIRQDQRGEVIFDSSIRMGDKTDSSLFQKLDDTNALFNNAGATASSGRIALPKNNVIGYKAPPPMRDQLQGYTTET